MPSIPAFARLRAGRPAAIVLAGALALSACSGGEDGGDAAGGETIAISVAASKGSIPGLPPIVAQEKGFFTKHGLKVNLITSLRGGAAIMSALTSGSADVVAQTVSAGATAKQQGASLPLLSAQSSGVPYLLVVGPKRSDTPAATPGEDGWQETIRSLKGATIAASGPGTAFDTILKGLFHDAGLSEKDFSNINIAHGGPEVAAMKTGQIDAAVVDIGTGLSLIDEAGGREVLDMSALGPQWLTQQAWSGFMSAQKTLDAKPGLAEKWQAAMAETRAYMQDPANLKDLHEIAVKVSGIPENPQLDNALTRFGKLLLPSFTTEQVQTTIDYMVDTGQLKEDPKVTPDQLVVPGVIASGS